MADWDGYFNQLPQADKNASKARALRTEFPDSAGGSFGSANIAEGYGRANPGDNHRHLSIAQGSLKELETLLEVAKRLDYSVSGIERVGRDCRELGKMLWRLIGAVRKRRSNKAGS